MAIKRVILYLSDLDLLATERSERNICGEHC